MKKQIGALLLAALVLGMGLSGCDTYGTSPESASSQAGDVTADPQAALDEIYAECEISGILDGDAKTLEEKFRITPNLYTEKYVRYSDGRFGIADVLILKPAPDQEDALRDALENAQVIRITEFSNYDIYNSLELAQAGEIYEVGDYLVLTMIDKADETRAVIEQHILQQVTLLPATDLSAAVLE